MNNWAVAVFFRILRVYSLLRSDSSPLTAHGSRFLRSRLELALGLALPRWLTDSQNPEVARCGVQPVIRRPHSSMAKSELVELSVT